nr:transposase [Liquorilactobacillus sicerae]
MMVSVLAYDIVNFLKQLGLSKYDLGLRLSTLQIFLFKVVARVAYTGRRIQLRPSSRHVYHRLFYQVLYSRPAKQKRDKYAQMSNLTQH